MISSIVLGIFGVGVVVGVGSSALGYAVVNRFSRWWRYDINY